MTNFDAIVEHIQQITGHVFKEFNHRAISGCLLYTSPSPRD